ncbi:hypothetical protein [Iamia sp.]|uniref:hypothetical protein n=1 Tax=Iamia sp. TaxID=2722710 RepID=UPI002C7396E2|nr:hypothetical protein [Iamia sp.]HXH57882.1 hypothetical protein [Iamia sp.]
MPNNLVDRLIEQADQLAGTWKDTPGRPREVDLRRAVSASYYALFHEVTNLLARWLAPNLLEADQQRLRRHPSHGGIKRVCGWVINPGGAPIKLHFARSLATIASGHSEIANVAQVFLDLQQHRHEADYDHLAVLTKEAVLTDIADAERAVADLRTSLGTREFEAFATLLALCSSGRGDQ